LILED
jgi:hypothetical protein